MLFLMAGLALVLGIMALSRISEIRREFVALKAELSSLRESHHALRLFAISQGWTEDTDEMDGTAANSSGEGLSEPEPVNLAEDVPTQAPIPKSIDSDLTQETPVSPTSKPKRSWNDIEKMVGERWSVLLGGIAVALGAVFLVKFSIEAGLLNPATRVALGFLVSFGLLGGGEWLRRRDKKLKIAVINNADIPSVLTAAGIIGSFAAMYAGYALYGLFGSGVAFVGLTLIGLAALVLSSLHGSFLAAIGALGAYLTPLLVSSGEPNVLALTMHVLIVTGSVIGIAHIRQWTWIGVGGILGGAAWTLLAATIHTPISGVCGGALVLGISLVLFFSFAPRPLDIRKVLDDGTGNSIELFAWLAMLVAFIGQMVVNPLFPALSVGVLFVCLLMLCANWFERSGSISLIAAVAAIFTVLGLDVYFLNMPGMYSMSDLAANLVPADIAGYLWRVGVIEFVGAGLGLYGALRAAKSSPKLAGYLASSAGVIIFFSMLIAYLRISPFETRPIFGLVALISALVLVGFVRTFSKVRPDDLHAAAPAALAVTAVSLLSFAIGVSVSKSWMPLGFAISGTGIAYIFMWRPLAALPMLTVLSALISGIALWFSVPFESVEIGMTPIFNNLIILIGAPAAALLLAGEILRRARAEKYGAYVTAIGLAALALFISLELRHWINGGDIVGGRFTFVDMAVQSIAALGFTIGLQIVAKRTSISILNKASVFAGYVSMAVLAFSLLIVFNPLLTNDRVGSSFVLNLLLLGYLIPAILAGFVAYMAGPIRPRGYTFSYASISGLLLFFYVTMMTRLFFASDGKIGLLHSTSDLEIWSYSLVWLCLGALVLSAGIVFKSLPMRMAAALLILLAVLKVFVFDLSALTGILRAASFLGLGGLLILVGRYYQRILVGSKATNDD